MPWTRRPGRSRDSSGPRLWPLAAVASVVVLLAVLGVLPVWSGLPHLVAVPPLDLYTDLRVLLTRARSLPEFAGLLILVFGARTAVLALMLGGLSRRRIGFAATCYASVALPLFVAAQFNYVSFAVLYGRVFWITVAGVALVVVLGAAVPWQGSTRLRTAIRRSWRGGLRVGVVLAYAVAAVLIGVVAETWPVTTIWLVPVSAALTALAVRAFARSPRPGGRRRLAVAAAMFLAASVVFVATRGVDPDPSPPPRAGSLLLMSGINSSSGDGAVFGVEPAKYGMTCEQVYYFSYAGLGNGQPEGDAVCPIRTGAPFVQEHTHRPMAELAESLAEQVRGLPRPLIVAAHSHSAWVAWLAVAKGMVPEVDVLVLAGPLPDSAHGYLGPDERGPGRVASDLLRLIAPATRIAGFNFEPDAPAFRSMLGDRHGPERIMSLPLPEKVRVISIPSTGDLPVLPSGWELPVDRNACPVREPHTSLPASEALLREVNRFLDGEPPPPCPPWRSWGVPMSRPFGVPPAP